MRTNLFLQIFILLIIISLQSCDNDENPVGNISGNSKILFLSQRLFNSQDWQIYTLDQEGNNQKRICDSIVICNYAIPSNSGSLIAFTTYTDNYYNLYLIDSSGNNLKLISKGKRNCRFGAWSPDDSKILFTKNTDFGSDRTDIYSYDLKTNIEYQLTNSNDNYCPSWIFSGSRIAFTSSDSKGSFVCLMNSNGLDKKRISPDSISLCGQIISPDNRTFCAVSCNFEGSQLYVMDIDGNNLKQITFTVSPEWIDRGFPRDANRNPVWSPDGKKIAYVSYENGNADIFIINPDGSNKKQLTDDPANDNHPCWSFDSKNIIFSSYMNKESTWDIFIMNSDGSNLKSLSNNYGFDSYPKFMK